MKAINKMLSFLTIMLLVIPAAVMAVIVQPTFTSEVKVNGHLMSVGIDTLEMVRGDSLELDLAVKASEDVPNVRWRAWIGGYEADVIEVRSEMFDLNYDEVNQREITNLHTLTLNLPADMDASEDYTLHVELMNSDVEDSWPIDLLVTRDRHRVDVQDVLVSPSTSVNAGDSVFVTVRLENMGDRKEEDLKVTVNAFGQSTSTYVNELAAYETPNEDEESSDSSNALLVRVPKDAQTGNYNLNVEVSYNRGRDTVTATKVIQVAGKAVAESNTNVDALVSVDASTLSVAQGAEASYRVSFANVGTETQLFSVKATGTQLWADSRAEPSFVSVAPGQTGEVVVYLKAHSDAELGNKLFTLQIYAGDKPVKEIAVGAKVNEAAKAAPTGSVVSDLLSTSTLKLGFVALVVLLVIVGLVVALRKLKEDDDYPLEPKDGKTYY